MAPSIAQCAVAAAVAWMIAKDLLGHDRPFFAPIAAVTCIGINLGRRMRRVGELVVGVGVGIGVGDLLISQIGSGPWQIGVVVALAMTAAVLVDRGPVIALQAGSSAVLVATLLPPGGTGGLDRMVDALVGGAVGIVAVALLPAHPATIVHRHASAVLDALATALTETAGALSDSDLDRATAALEDARATQKAVEELREALHTGREITSISPLRRHWRRQLLRYETARAPVDLALRNTRVLARRAIVALREGETPPPALAGMLRDLARATALLRDELAGGREPAAARRAILDVAGGLGTVQAGATGLSGGVMTALVRSIVVDLLRATGTEVDAALAALPRPEEAAEREPALQERPNEEAG